MEAEEVQQKKAKPTTLVQMREYHIEGWTVSAPALQLQQQKQDTFEPVLSAVDEKRRPERYPDRKWQLGRERQKVGQTGLL